MDVIHDWLTETPTHTCLRVNILKSFDIMNLEKTLVTLGEKLNTAHLPNFYFLKPDCLILERWPEGITTEKAKCEVIVDGACAAAVLRGSHVFAPGVLGLPPNCKLDDVVDIYGDIGGKCKRGLKIGFDDVKRFAGVGCLKKLRRDLFDEGIQPSGIAVQTLLPASRLPVVNDTLFPTGQVLLQNLPSLVCGWVVNAQPNEYILDMCAAPGNKTTHLAEMALNKAYITALDKSERRVNLIRETCAKQGVTCVTAFVCDSRQCYSNNSNGGITSPPFPLDSFDKVLLDAPCSGLGQRPQLVNKMSPKMLQSFTYVQRKLFEAAEKVLKVGGKLVYSTCTTTLEENEDMVKWALQNLPSLRLIPAEPLHGGPGLDSSSLTTEERLMVQRFGPENDPLRPTEDIYRNSIGFFIAAFTKVQQNTLI
ncbi:tRNA (cytosine(72)-C(5))-methyltransferase NSUN6 isoform X1 [Leptidea sinapis]|uniref:tRNA (cytosine(72)-C(5))-methyltransferase NSUN6 isoform X1 n=1 Tax=Leptidea sinapis TaxID=189913 RepID=UPI002122674C|nr:tRNA (cytosine(72)-C(5))-methyltransferase NSUN6 isoform X1 [Leptidea sinapis]